MAKPKILLVVHQHSAARFISADFAAAFDAAGYPTRLADFAPALLAKNNGAVAALVREIRAFAPDLALGYGMESFVPLPGAGDLFTLLDVPLINLFFDFHDWDPVVLRRHPLFARMTGPECLYGCWDTVARERMRADGFPRVEYLPLAVNPRVFTRLRPPGRTRPVPVSFIGVASPERVRRLEPLVPLGLAVHGPGSKLWEQSAALRPAYHGAENDRVKLNQFYNDARLSVNLTQAHGRDSLNMRVFEALATGSLLVTDEMPVLGQTFRIGEEVVTYRAGELESTVRYWLAHPDEGARIAQRGCEAVLAGHTYRHRVDAIAEWLPEFIIRRETWCRALAAGEGGNPAAAVELLLPLLTAVPPFAWPEHLLYNLWKYSRAIDPAAAEKFRVRLKTVNPESYFLKTPTV